MFIVSYIYQFVSFVVSLSLHPLPYPIRTVIQLSDVEKQKEPITQSIRNRREHGSRFKVMFYVIGSENSKSGSAFYSSRQQNQRRGGAVRYFRCTDTVSDETDLWWNINEKCKKIILPKLDRIFKSNFPTTCRE